MWTAQLEAIVDDKEMKALKNKLDIRRQKLKDRIDYNNTRMEEAGNSVMRLVKKYPEMAEDIMNVVNSFEGE